MSVGDVYVALVGHGFVRIVADALTFTYEVALDHNEEFLYVAETTGKRVSHLRLGKVGKDGALTKREVFGPSYLGKGFSNGISFDSFGNL